MRTTKRAVVVALVSVGLTACDRVVNITVPDAPEQLVVEGRVEAVLGETGGRQLVVLTTSAPYFRNQAAPPARGAQVSITDGTGRTTVLRESSTQPGYYLTDSLVGRVAMRYTLRIRWRGDDFEAVDSLTAVPPIDSLYFAEGTDDGFDPGGEPPVPGLRATIDTRDLPGVANFYLWDMFVNGKRVDPSDSTARSRAVASDQFYDGRPVRGLQPREDTPVASGQLIQMRQQSLSEQLYRYFRALNDQVNADGTPFAVPPNSLRGNVANLTRPAERALGYFMATNVSERQRRVP